MEELTGRINAVRNSLHEIDRRIDPNGPFTEWVVRESYTRARTMFLLVGAHAGSKKRESEAAPEPLDILVFGLKSLKQAPEMPEYYSDRTISQVIKVGRKTSDFEGVSVVAVNGTRGDSVELDGGLIANARESIRGSQQGFGAVVGRLDILNSRRKGQKIGGSILDERNKRSVRISAGHEMQESLTHHFNSRVMVAGNTKMNDRGQILSLEVQTIESYERYASLAIDPSVLYGVAPDFTGGLDPVEFIRALRRESSVVVHG